MANHDKPKADVGPAITEPETGHSYCCECGTYDAHGSRCLCCGFDFRAGPETAAR